MILVCNTGPIIALAKIDRLEILPYLGEAILIPETVFYELMGKPGEETSRILGAASGFLKVSPPPASVAPHVALATRHLDAGERAVICMASALHPNSGVLLDDAAGRETARSLGIPVSGFIGALLAAKQRGLIGSVCPLVEEARNAGYWLADDLVATARRLAGE